MWNKIVANNDWGTCNIEACCLFCNVMFPSIVLMSLHPWSNQRELFVSFVPSSEADSPLLHGHRKDSVGFPWWNTQLAEGDYAALELGWRSTIKRITIWVNPKKVCSFLVPKKPIFILRDTLSKPIVFDFLYFFIEEKNFASILKNIYFFTRVFPFFHPFASSPEEAL